MPSDEPSSAGGSSPPHPKPRRLPAWRLLLILGIGAAAIFAADRYRRTLRPTPAPEAVQQEGIALIESLLTKVRVSEFGHTPRGRRLIIQIGEFLRRGRVIFTAEIRSQALYRRELFGFEALYVKLFRMGRGWVHQDPELIAEGLFHEAVHALRSRAGRASIEEECDGFAAGLAAGAAVTGRQLPDILTLDGLPIAEFVRRAYPAHPRRADYEPVGETLDWLLRRTGLTTPAAE